MALEQDVRLYRQIASMRHFIRVFRKQGTASEYSGGRGDLTEDEEAYLEAIQSALDARDQ